MEFGDNYQEDGRVSLRADTNQDEYILSLLREKEQYASEGRYLEAENIKRKIQEIKENKTGQKKRDLDYQHMTEMRNLEDNYNKELGDFNEEWDNKFMTLQEKARKMEEALMEKHKREMEELINNLDAKLPKQVKFSKEYLDLKQSEMNLVKQERYVEAHFIKTKCDMLERNEFEKHNKDRNEKIRIKSEQLAQKHNLEKNGLKQKFDSDFDELRIQKDHEASILVLKYKNRKLDLELQQKQEKNLSENSNLMKAKTASTKFSATQKNFGSTSPQKFTFYPPELRIKEISKNMKRGSTEENKPYNFNSPINNYKNTSPEAHLKYNNHVVADNDSLNLSDKKPNENVSEHKNENNYSNNNINQSGNENTSQHNISQNHVASNRDHSQNNNVSHREEVPHNNNSQLNENENEHGNEIEIEQEEQN